MSGRPALAVALSGSAGLVVALLLAGSNGLAALAYVLFLCAVALGTLVRGLRAELQTAPALDRLRVRPRIEPGRVEQLESLARTLTGAGWSQAELHYRLRPLVRDIAAARLSRLRGIDLEHQPERADAAVGGRVWELVRPDREPPEDRHAAGWSRPELAALLDELEAI